MDEAGYGPNLGPLVISATVWEVPGDPHGINLWELLADSVRQTADTDGRLHMADSKQVYQPQRGISELERSVLAALASVGKRPDSLEDLIEVLGQPDSLSSRWYRERTIPLPCRIDHASIEQGAEHLTKNLARQGVNLLGIHSVVIEESRYNDLVEDRGSKGAVLTESSLSLMRSVWSPTAEIPTLIVADKHGGRGRYGAALANVCDGAFLTILEEGRSVSRYRLGQTEIRFQTAAESHLPVALASMVSKYVREVAMEALNAFWATRVPELRPTKGYPVDARRFQEEVDSARQDEGIAWSDFWRCR